MCVVKLGSFHGCFFCKVNNRGCSLCPKVEGTKVAASNVRPKNWCWYLTLIHHIASILELDQPEGPLAVLPSYEGVQFPPFNQQLAKLIGMFKTTMSDDEINKEWARIKLNPPTPYYGIPHNKLLELGMRRPERGRFPVVGNGIEVQRKLCSILTRAKEGTLSRLWAVGYSDTWTRPGQIKVLINKSTKRTRKSQTIAASPESTSGDREGSSF